MRKMTRSFFFRKEGKQCECQSKDYIAVVTVVHAEDVVSKKTRRGGIDLDRHYS